MKKFKTKKTQSEGSGVIVSTSFKRPKKLLQLGTLFSKRSKRVRIIIIAIGLVLIIGGGSVAYTNYNNYRNRPKPTRILTPLEGAHKQVDKLRDNPPAHTANSNEQALYEKKLSYALAEIGDYKGAVKAFERRESLAASTLQFMDYYEVAQYYHFAGDNQAALRALDKSQALVPATFNADSDYNRVDVLASIEKLRKEYSK